MHGGFGGIGRRQFDALAECGTNPVGQGLQRALDAFCPEDAFGDRVGEFLGFLTVEQRCRLGPIAVLVGNLGDRGIDLLVDNLRHIGLAPFGADKRAVVDGGEADR